MKQIQSVEELVEEIAPLFDSLPHPNLQKDSIRYAAYINDKEYLRVCVKSLLKHAQEEIEKGKQDEHPTEDGVPVETYGYEAEHNKALDESVAIVQSLIIRTYEES